ncbi:MAG: asparaginase domain-containing protein [Pseudobutyrivibrio sp.]|nr:asparaginase domain-containing protein [Pseudobutyrivibrio sp.]
MLDRRFTWVEKRGFFVYSIILLVVFLTSGCAASQAQNKKASEPTEVINENKESLSEAENKNEKGTVVILATGGTIAGAGEEGKETGYKSGTLSVDSLVDAVPGLTDISNIKAEQICNVNSDDITSEIWIELANKINEMAQDENISGFVITHGTDTMEETAYFLNVCGRNRKYWCCTK